MSSLRLSLTRAFDLAPGSMSRRVLGLAWPSVVEQSLGLDDNDRRFIGQDKSGL